MKKLISLMLALAMVVALVGCTTPDVPVDTSTPPVGVDETPPPEIVEDTGKVFNIYCWNTEFQERFNEFATDLIPDDVEVNWIITPSDGGAYQLKLDEVLPANEGAEAKDKVDLFLIEADYALKYVNSPYALDVYSQVGLTAADTADMYQYTKDICTDSDGVLKGVSWQACPGGLIYRRSIAKEVIGSDDPETVQAALDNWDKFDAVAADAKAKGYYMTSGFVANYRVFSNNVSAPWVNDQNQIVFDPAIVQWIEMSKDHMDKGYTLPYGIWDTESFNEAKVDGKAMCYFGPGWFFDFCLMPATLADADAAAEPGNGSYGDWGLVKGPQGFFWGGTWICAAAGSDNLNLTREIMKRMCCDKDTLLAITNQLGDFTNNVTAMEEVAESDYGHPFLGGQNHIAVLLASAQSIDMSNSSPYDQMLNEPLPAAFKDYFLGTVTLEKAYDNFYMAAIETYPSLTRP
ncbi:MAG: extracellular solute-binding protein [Christensenellales bacterium]